MEAAGRVNDLSVNPRQVESGILARLVDPIFPRPEKELL